MSEPLRGKVKPAKSLVEIGQPLPKHELKQLLAKYELFLEFVKDCS